MHTSISNLRFKTFEERDSISLSSLFLLTLPWR
nr:MAG TPA: hypothetical protein [Caudoviricetes sp.]